MVQSVQELENLLYLMENSKHWDGSQLQLIQQFRTMIESNEISASKDIDVHAKGLRFDEADTNFYKHNLVDIRHELSSLECSMFEVLCEYMSQDNIIVITMAQMMDLLSIRRRNNYSDTIKHLEQLGYICKIPLEELSLRRPDGLALMVNPLFATKSRDTTQINKFFMDHADPDVIEELKSRFKDIEVDVRQTSTGSATVKNHKIRYNKIKSVNKKVSAVHRQTDTKSPTNIITLYDTLNQAQGDN